MIDKIQWEIDPIAAVITFLALVASIAAIRESRRARAVSTQAYEQAGQIRAIALEFVGWDVNLRSGRPVGHVFPITGGKITPNAHTLARVYSGAASIEIQRATLVVLLNRGVLARRTWIVRIPLGLGDGHSNSQGPTLPAELPPFRQAEWRLPPLVIAGPLPKRVRDVQLPPRHTGIFFLTPFERLSFFFMVSSATYGDDKTHVKSFAYPAVFPSPGAGRLFRYEGLETLLKDQAAPQTLRNMLSSWHVSASEPIDTPTSSKERTLPEEKIFSVERFDNSTGASTDRQSPTRRKRNRKPGQRRR